MSRQSGGGTTFPVIVKTANYTMSLADAMIVVNAASLTVTLPTAVQGQGRIWLVKNGASGASTTVLPGSGTIDGAANYLGLLGAYAAASFMSDGANWYVV